MKLTKETIKRINDLNNGKVLASKIRGRIAEILIKQNILKKPKVSHTKCR